MSSDKPKSTPRGTERLHSAYGVYLFGSFTTGTQIEGNLIGTAADGRTTFRAGGTFRQLAGVAIVDASANTIGGASAAAGNLITGNDQAGVYILGHNNSSQGNLVAHNRIGTNASGRPGAGNRQYGVLLFNAPANPVPQRGASRNLFSHNGIANLREFTGAENSGAARATTKHRKTQVAAQVPAGPIPLNTRRKGASRAR